MSKGIPYFRHVRYTDDGCDVWQCLSCKKEWESRTGVRSDWEDKRSWRFCPFCGCDWADELRWDEEKKWGKGYSRQYVSDEAYTKRVRPLKFTIERRYIPVADGKFLREEAGEWEIESERCPDAIEAAGWIKRLEQQDEEAETFGMYEYRATPEENK